MYGIFEKTSVIIVLGIKGVLATQRQPSEAFVTALSFPRNIIIGISEMVLIGMLNVSRVLIKWLWWVNPCHADPGYTLPLQTV